MQKTVYLLLVLYFISLQCFGQRTLYSLHQLVKSYNVEDTTRVKILNQTGYEYWVVNAVEAEQYGQQALYLAKKLQYLPGVAMANRVIGVSHWSRGNFYHALTHLFQSQEQYKSLNDKLGEANATLNIGLVYGDQMYDEQALKFYFDALKIFEALKREDRVATTFTKIGTVYTKQKRYAEAYTYLIQALDIHHKNNFEFGILEVSNRLGILYSQQGHYDQAEQTLKKSLALAEKRKDYEHISKNLENLGDLELKRKNYSQAEHYLLRAYPIAESMGYKKWLRDIAIDLKKLYTIKNNPKAALFYFEKYQAVKDSIFNEEKAMHMANLQIEQQMKEKEQNLKLRKQEILLLQEQTRFDGLVRWVLIASIFILLIVAYFIFKNQRFRIKKNQELMLNQQLLYESKHALAEVELENARLKQEELNKELAFKNKELTSYTMNFIHKNELFDALREKLELVKKQADATLSKELNAVLRLIQGNQNIDKDWEDFKRSFENVHHNFFSQLVQYCPDLSPTELKLCALIKLNLNMKETASMMGISAESVKTARYRLRKKLSLQQEQSLTDFMMNFSGVTTT